MKKNFKNYIYIPKNINCKIIENYFNIKGILGFLKLKLNKIIEINIKDNTIFINSKYEIRKRINTKSIILTTKSLIKNMIIGVTNGYLKKLILFGIGYKVENFINNSIRLFLGFSHPIIYKIPNNIKIECKNNIEIFIEGIDKQLVGQVASEIRNFKKPDIYKGKGIRYLNEKINFKESKKTK